MLNGKGKDGGSYEGILADALSRVLLYSGEWTNFNRSDPGVTILQNLSAFTALQQAYLGEVTDEIKLGLLGLLGCRPKQVHPAALFAAPEERAFRILPAHKKLYVGGLCFETLRPETLYPWSLAAAYVCEGGRYRDVTYLVDSSNALSAEVFGGEPREGGGFTCVLAGEICEGMSLIFYAEIEDENLRNAFEEVGEPSFAETEWQYYTARGWVRAEAEDETRCFLNSGIIRLRLCAGAPAVFTGTPVSGYALRCVLCRAEYDSPPRLSAFCENLVELCQRDTRAASFTFAGGEPVRVFSGMTAYENLFVYCREGDESGYRAYEPYAGQAGAGRFYLRAEEQDGAVTVLFDEERFGFAPCAGAGAVRVVCYEGDMLHHRLLGVVGGYENQRFTVDAGESLIAKGFMLLAEQKQADGGTVYSFITPGDGEPDSLCYKVLPEPGAVKVQKSGLAGDCRLYLCDCAVTAGAGGNIRGGSRLAARAELYAEVREPAYLSAGQGRGGAEQEQPEQLRRRFAAERKRASAAVLLQDYEELALRTPGLCLHKARAIADEENNRVKIVVKPAAQGRFPKLSPLYLRQIRAYLEPRRMITTRIELLQPQYTEIDVSLAVRVKNYYGDLRGAIEALLERELDFITTGHGFGETVRTAELYRKLGELEGVDAIYSLVLRPNPRGDAAVEGGSIRLGESTLCCLGALELEMTSSQ